MICNFVQEHGLSVFAQGYIHYRFNPGTGLPT